MHRLTAPQIEIAYAIHRLRQASIEHKVNHGYLIGFTAEIRDIFKKHDADFDPWAFHQLCVPERDEDETK